MTSQATQPRPARCAMAIAKGRYRKTAVTIAAVIARLHQQRGQLHRGAMICQVLSVCGVDSVLKVLGDTLGRLCHFP